MSDGVGSYLRYQGTFEGHKSSVELCQRFRFQMAVCNVEYCIVTWLDNSFWQCDGN